MHIENVQKKDADVAIYPDLRFIDESLDVAHYYGHIDMSERLKISNWWSPNLSRLTTAQDASHRENGLLFSPHVQSSPSAPVECDSNAEYETSPSCGSQYSALNSDKSLIQLASSRKNLQEAFLMRYFVEELAQWVSFQVNSQRACPKPVDDEGERKAKKENLV